MILIAPKVQSRRDVFGRLIHEGSKRLTCAIYYGRKDEFCNKAGIVSKDFQNGQLLFQEDTNSTTEGRGAGGLEDSTPAQLA